MKLAACLTLWMTLAWTATAHVGSPDVFFSGQAGSHPVVVIIQPPKTLPGVARVEVRLEEDPPATVLLTAAFRGSAPSEVPAPIAASPVPEHPRTYRADLWLLRRGQFSVEVAVSGARGRGTVSIPLNSAALQAPTMPLALAAPLAAMGAVLIAGWLLLARAAGGQKAVPITALLIASALAAGAWRWKTMDGEFRSRALDRPVQIGATVLEEKGHALLHLESLAESAKWDALVTDHGKLMHLFLVAESAGGAFAHLHPVRRDAKSFECLLPPLPAGSYRLYGEITFANAASQTLTARLTLPAQGSEIAQAALTARDDALCQTVLAPEENDPRPEILGADDAWNLTPPHLTPGLVTSTSCLPDGGTVVLHNAGDLVQNRETSLRFSVYAASGALEPLRPYMGMAGHTVVYREDASVFTHLHPAGTISMASQRLLAGSTENSASAETPGAEITFPYAFPQPGTYRVWAQFRTRRGIVTGAFQVSVRAAGP